MNSAKKLFDGAGNLDDAIPHSKYTPTRKLSITIEEIT
jgi:hypothetical protein